MRTTKRYTLHTKKVGLSTVARVGRVRADVGDGLLAGLKRAEVALRRVVLTDRRRSAGWGAGRCSGRELVRARSGLVGWRTYR